MRQQQFAEGLKSCRERSRGNEMYQQEEKEGRSPWLGRDGFFISAPYRTSWVIPIVREAVVKVVGRIRGAWRRWSQVGRNSGPNLRLSEDKSPTREGKAPASQWITRGCLENMTNIIMGKDAR